MHGMSKIVHISRGHSSYRDSAVLGQIDSELLDDLANLIDKKRQFQLLNKSKLIKNNEGKNHPLNKRISHFRVSATACCTCTWQSCLGRTGRRPRAGSCSPCSGTRARWSPTLWESFSIGKRLDRDARCRLIANRQLKLREKHK